MIHYYNLNQGPFQTIKNGEKWVEMRLNDEKRQQLKVGDNIIFTNIENGKEMLLVEIKALKVFKNFVELYKNYQKEAIGYKKDEIADPKDMYEYYSPEKIAIYHALAIEFKLLGYFTDFYELDHYLIENL